MIESSEASDVAPGIRRARVPASPIIPLPDAPIEYPPPQESDPEEAAEEDREEPGVPGHPEPISVPSEPIPALPTGHEIAPKRG